MPSPRRACSRATRLVAPVPNADAAEKRVPVTPGTYASVPGADAAEKRADMPAETDAVPALEARGLTFSYGENADPVFSDLSLAVGRGEVVLVMGASGCGKSTLALCLAGLYPAYAGVASGAVLAAGRSVAEMGPRERSREVSILFQNPDNQFCMDTVEREVLFALENVGWEGDMRARCRELLALVGLEERAGERIGRLSGGTKQKLALCTALACGARTLVLDEPFANLDPASCASLSAELARLNAELGVTLLVVDHRAGWWLPFASRVVLMRASGSLDEASFAPADLLAHEGRMRAAGLFVDEQWAAGYAPVQVAPDARTLVRARGLSVGYGRGRAFSRVLAGVDLDVARGSVCALVGECGSGKSTLLHAIAGACETSGELDVEGSVGLVFQNPRLQFLALTVTEEVLVTLRAANPGVADEDLAARVPALLEEFGLAGLGERSPYEISQGQQRRLAMLAMLAGNAGVLLLDEPTYAQDERSTRRMLDMLMGRVAAGLTVIVATHDLVLARAVANQVLLVQDGGVRPLVADEFETYARGRREPAWEGGRA